MNPYGFERELTTEASQLDGHLRLAYTSRFIENIGGFTNFPPVTCFRTTSSDILLFAWWTGLLPTNTTFPCLALLRCRHEFIRVSALGKLAISVTFDVLT